MSAPLQFKLPNPKSSARIKTIFGFLVPAACSVESEAPVAAAVRKKFRRFILFIMMG